MDRPAQIDFVLGGTVRVALTGAVIMVQHEDVLSQVERAMKAAHALRVQVDLTAAAALDSSGVALLVLTRRLATRCGAEFQLHGAGPEIVQHLHMAGLTTLFGLRPADGGDGPDTGMAGQAPDDQPPDDQPPDDQPPEVPAAVVDVLDEPFDRQGIPAIRDRLLSYATSCGLSGFDQYKLVLAATEIMTNAVLHGGGRGTIRVERHGERLILRITDRGPGIPRQQRVTYPRSRPGRVRSAGLWLARQICLRVDIDTGPGGTIVSLTYALPLHAE
ncbi:ATP-binding protein [Krasilnikovia sp. M28-CT-15]|uniref:ATP-binding protein n=1 Tax=Krasilnikovia sp. M28-CT-15 TaxID=3373540 RepID=UPI0038769937